MKPPLIALIESNGEAVELARFALWRSNFHCVLQWYDDPEAAMDMLQRARRHSPADPMPAMVFLDGSLFEDDGADFLATLRASRRTSTLPVIVFSCRITEEQKSRLLQAGASECLPKPELDSDYMKSLLDCVARWSLD